MTADRRWKQRPPGSNWGDFGDDDRLGRLNLITPERRRAAVAEVRAGLAFCLSLPLDVGAGLNTTRQGPALQAVLRKDEADAVVLTLPDSLAWLFNIRGADVAHNPVALSFAIVPASGKSPLTSL